MLKKAIKYKDFEDVEREETFYFNISKPELVKLQVEKKEGFGEWISNIVKAENMQVLMEQFERIIMLAYGEKSEDGKHFIKSDELSQKFKSSAAYVALFEEMITSETAAADFLTGVLPKDLVESNAAALTPAPPSA